MKTNTIVSMILMISLALTTACKKEKPVKPFYFPSEPIVRTANEAIVTNWMQLGVWTEHGSTAIKQQIGTFDVPGITQKHLSEGKVMVFARFKEYQAPVAGYVAEVKLPYDMVFKSNFSYFNEYWKAYLTDQKITISVQSHMNQFVNTGGVRSQNSFRAFILMPGTIQNLALRGIPEESIEKLSYQRMCALLEVEP